MSRPRAVIGVAMSGGVDSSVAASLCVEAGHEVFGVMARLWSESDDGDANRCCSARAVEEARQVADILGIEFTMLDLRQAFKQLVVDEFLADVAAGDTPNPCFNCNRRLRFGLLQDEVTRMGADQLATGHYARIDRAHGRYRLLRGVDQDKDQSYMLHRLGADQPSRARFPLGAMTKREVRAKARELGLPVASREDSTDLCWVAEDGLEGFLERHLPTDLVTGPIEDMSGSVVGEHHGLPLYTVGQRHGLGVAFGYPAYVVRRDFCRNVLVVGPSQALSSKTVAARDWHWIAGSAPPSPIRVEAQIRYRARAGRAALEVEHDRVVARFDEPQRAPAPGQGLVAYDGDECLGGGIIVEQSESRS